MTTDFGKYLKELRKKKGISTHELAEVSGVSQSYISHLENGRKKNPPSPEILLKLKDPLGVSHVHLMVQAGYLEGPEEDYLETEYEKEATTQQIKENDIKHLILSRPQLNYNGKILSSDDKKRILDMLDILFKK